MQTLHRLYVRVQDDSCLVVYVICVRFGGDIPYVLSAVYTKQWDALQVESVTKVPYKNTRKVRTVMIELLAITWMLISNSLYIKSEITQLTRIELPTGPF